MLLMMLGGLLVEWSKCMVYDMLQDEYCQQTEQPLTNAQLQGKCR